MQAFSCENVGLILSPECQLGLQMARTRFAIGVQAVKEKIANFEEREATAEVVEAFDEFSLFTISWNRYFQLIRTAKVSQYILNFSVDPTHDLVVTQSLCKLVTSEGEDAQGLIWFHGVSLMWSRSPLAFPLMMLSKLKI